MILFIASSFEKKLFFYLYDNETAQIPSDRRFMLLKLSSTGLDTDTP